MNTEEYIKLNDLEKNHWFYKGKRELVRLWIGKFKVATEDPVLLDVGAGTGYFVEHMKSSCRAYGVEPNPTAIECARQSNSHHSLIVGSINPLPIAHESIDIVTSLDVLEHIQDDRRAMQELIRVTKENGIIVITVPACSWAMSDWDTALGHYRRYDLKDLQLLLEKQPVEILEKRYFNNLLFWPIVFYRSIRKKLNLAKSGRLEDVLLPNFINQFFYYSLLKPALWPNVRFPFGLSILLILKKTRPA